MNDKQTQEYRVELMGDSAFIISAEGGRRFINGETLGSLTKEAALIHHLTGKGPKELVEQATYWEGQAKMFCNELKESTDQFIALGLKSKELAEENNKLSSFNKEIVQKNVDLQKENKTLSEKLKTNDTVLKEMEQRLLGHIDTNKKLAERVEELESIADHYAKHLSDHTKPESVNMRVRILKALNK